MNSFYVHLGKDQFTNRFLFQIEDWKFVSIPDPDWALVVWCGSNPVLKYNGAFVVSRQRSLQGIPQVNIRSICRLVTFLT